MAWVKLKNEQNEQNEGNETFLSRFVYPFIGLITLATFVGNFLSRRDFDLQSALKMSILSLISSIGGFFLASYLLNEIWNRFFGREKDFKLCQRFIGYSFVAVFAVDIILSLLPEFFFLKIFMLYTIYIVWEGARLYMEVDETGQLKLSLIATALIIFVPVLIEIIFRILMPGLRV
jgi:hypothetical protein